jgi:enterochelin esterase-like enzyme
MKLKKILLLSLGTLLVLGGAGYSYVFLAGAPQLDPPSRQIKGTGLSWQLATYKSQAMGEEREYGLILPSEYKENPQQRYPVIFLLHGGNDNARSWQDEIGIISVLHQLYQSKRLPPSIIITPDGNDKRGSSPILTPQYYDGVNGKVATAIGSELVGVVKSRYRTLPSPQFWAIGGNAAGGWGAFNIGLRYLDNFNLLFSHNGYFVDSNSASNSPIYVVQQLPKAQLKKLRIYLDAGKADADRLASTEEFHQVLNRLNVENVFYKFSGGQGLVGSDRGWNYYHRHTTNSLSYIGQELTKANSQH